MVQHSELDLVYAALADPTRRSMIERLREGARSVSDLGAGHDMTLAAVGKHVAVLERAGVVRSRKTGRVRTCELVTDSLDEAGQWIARERLAWTARLDALSAHLEEHP